MNATKRVEERDSGLTLALHLEARARQQRAHASALFLTLLSRTLSQNVRSAAEREAVISDLGGLLDRESRKALRIGAGLLSAADSV